MSREKENSEPEVLNERGEDRSEPRNNGILSDEDVGVSAGVHIRRVRYQEPVRGKTYSFMTSDLNLPPGLMAYRYKLHWDVEKVFDEKKNK